MDYRAIIESKFSWQQPFIDFSGYEAYPVTGGRWIVSMYAASPWVGHENAIKIWDGTKWYTDFPSKGWAIYISQVLMNGGIILLRGVGPSRG